MLEVKNLSKIYKAKGGTEVRALDDVTISFADKGMVFLLGKSGSGKSTLLNMCGGLDAPDSGEIIVKGRSSKDFKASDFDSYRNTYVGFIFQEYNVLDEFSVEDNLALALELQGKPKDSKIIAEILQKVELDDMAKRMPNTLSGGQKQRVAIARALVKNPEIIMADEPTGALDSTTGKQVLDTLKKLSQEKLVIVVSHDRDFAEEYGDRIIELQDGKVISDMIKITVSKQGKALKKPKFEPLVAQPKQAEYTPEDSKFIKSKLPSKHALKIGLSSIRLKPFRFAFTLIMAIVAFCMFGLFSCLIMYDSETVLTQSITDSGIQYLRKGKSYMSTETFYEADGTIAKSILPTGTSVSQKEVDEFTARYGEKVIAVYNIKGHSIDNLTFESTPANKECFYTNYIYGFIPSSSKLEYVSGKAPSGNGEIAVSQYIWECIQNGNMTDIASGELISDKSSYQKIKIAINGKELKISGIYKNELIPDLYRDANDDEDLAKAWEAKLRYGFFDYAIIDENCYEDFASLIGVNTFFPPQDTYIGDISKLVFEKLTGSNFIFNVIQQDNTRYVTNHGESAVSKDNGQDCTVILDYRAYFELIQEICAALSNPIHPDYSSEFTEKCRSAYDGTFYTILNNLVNGVYSSPSDIQTYGKKILDIVNKYFDMDNTDFKLHSFGKTDIILSKAKLLGYYYNSDLRNMAHFSQKACEVFAEQSKKTGSLQTITTKYTPDKDGNYIYSALFLPTNQNFDTVSDIMSYRAVSDKNDIVFIIENDLVFIIYGLSTLLSALAKVFLWVGVAMAVFTALLLANFISTSISQKKKEIGILRALGARGNDIFRIFLSEALIIALICILVANIVTVILTLIINKAMSNSISFTLSIFVFGWASVAMIVGIALLTSFIATFLPVFKASRKKPVESIRAL